MSVDGSARQADREGKCAERRRSLFAADDDEKDDGDGIKSHLPSSPVSIKKMSNLVPAYSIAEFYRSVIEDVVGRVRSEFVGEGVDE